MSLSCLHLIGPEKKDPAHNRRPPPFTVRLVTLFQILLRSSASECILQASLQIAICRSSGAAPTARFNSAGYQVFFNFTCGSEMSQSRNWPKLKKVQFYLSSIYQRAPHRLSSPQFRGSVSIYHPLYISGSVDFGSNRSGRNVLTHSSNRLLSNSTSDLSFL